MEQLSLPYRIVLIAAAVFGIFWFVALRPGTPSAPKTAPGVAGLSNATQAARGAVAQSDANAAAQQNAANAVDGSTPAVNAGSTQTPIVKAPGSAAAPSKARVVQDRSGPILADLKKGRVAVVAFSGLKAADDLGVRRALTGINLHGGKVVVRSVSIADVADYGAITRGVQVQQAPTVLVIGENRKAHSIVGFTDSSELNQLVGDVGGKGF